MSLPLLFAATLSAQARAPFQGRVLDRSGQPIANARVTCAFLPDFVHCGEPDRASARTEADGRFALPLVVGLAYTVWVLGPTGDDGSHAAMPPRAEAAAGKQLDLIASSRGGGHQLLVRGADAWLAQGPLSLRLMLGGGHLVGADLSLAGDGVVPLPPLPATRLDVALVDGQGRVLQQRACELAPKAAVAFDPPRQVPIGVLAETGQRVPGTRLLGADGWTLATTGASGIANVLVPAAPLQLCACRRDGERWLAAWLPGPREAAADDGHIDLLLRPQLPATLRVYGPAGARVGVWFQSRRRGLPVDHTAVPSERLAGGEATFVAARPLPPGELAAAVCIGGDGAVPQRVVARLRAQQGDLPPLDLAALRRVAVEVVDDSGHPVACAHLDVGVADAARADWLQRFVSDAGGRAELLLQDRLAVDVCAFGGGGFAVQRVVAGAAATLRLQLQPVQAARLQVVDAEGRPVAGARLLPLQPRFDGGRAGAPVSPRTLVAYLGECAGIEQLASDSDGMLTVPVLADAQPVAYFAEATGRRSEEFELAAGADVLRVAVQ